MDDDFEAWFQERYPEMFKNVYCGFYIPRGWKTLVTELCEELTREGFKGTVAQVKEKFGSLRFYVDDAGDRDYQIIKKYEDRSGRICEECGLESDTVRPQGRYWVSPFCEDHRGKDEV